MKRQGLFALAVILLTIGATLIVVAFVLVVGDRNRNSSKPTVARSLANQLEEAGLGCADYTSFTPIGKGIINDAQCRIDSGTVRIVVYKTPQALVYARNLTRNYQCFNKAAAGETQIVTVVKGAWQLEPATADPAAAQALQEVVGGEIVTVDCASPAPSAPPPAPDPAAPPA